MTDKTFHNWLTGKEETIDPIAGIFRDLPEVKLPDVYVQKKISEQERKRCQKAEEDSADAIFEMQRDFEEQGGIVI